MDSALPKSLREKCPYSEIFFSVVFRMRTEYREIGSISPYSVQMREITDQKNSKYGTFSRSVNEVSDGTTKDPFLCSLFFCFVFKCHNDTFDQYLEVFKRSNYFLNIFSSLFSISNFVVCEPRMFFVNTCIG